MKEDNFLLGQIEDKLSQCDNKYIVTGTGFLDAHQQSLCREYCRKQHVPIFDEETEYAALRSGTLPMIRTRFYGGYSGAERVIMINLPDYAVLQEQNPLVIIRAEKAAGAKELTHRDYLGSLIGLGIKREMIGDILVRGDGADIIVLAEIADYILLHYGKAGRVSLTLSSHSIEELILPQTERKVVTDTVASLRLDNVIASAFGLSRGKAAEAIGRGIVFVNHVEVTKADFQLKEGDKLTLRGKGKACLSEIGGKSRKDRQYITLEKY
ncbi:MAG: YlmH/Sll1252 family protein [Emergencia sp.]|nr:YlmH/Sll1252 family protein [Emergencia sp.]